jgi:hypothetical protein
MGRAVLGDEVVGMNAAKIWVSIAPTLMRGPREVRRCAGRASGWRRC